MKQLAKVLVGSRLHGTHNENSDYDYRGIYVESLKDTLSPFKKLKNTSWIEGDEDNTAYELREFCKLATKGNATILEVFFSDVIISTSPEHQEMRANWQKFMDTKAFIAASRGYASNQYKKALTYEDLGVNQQLRTAKFIISFLRVMWQCENFLRTGEFACSLEACPYFDFIKEIKGMAREDLNIPLCFAYMEQQSQDLYHAEADCASFNPERYAMKPDYDWIEDFIVRAYKN